MAMMDWANSDEGTEYIISINFKEDENLWYIFYIEEV